MNEGCRGNDGRNGNYESHDLDVGFHFSFDRFSLFNACAFMRELYTRFWGEAERGDAWFLLIPFGSSRFLPVPLGSRRFSQDFC